MTECAVANIGRTLRSHLVENTFCKTFVSGFTNDRSYGQIRKTINNVVNGCHSGTAGRALVFNQKYLER